MKNITKGYTHSGIFHADDVFSSALLKILYPDIVIERVFKVPELGETEIAFDIGGGEYDHHDILEYRPRPEYAEEDYVDIPYAAFGLLWRAFGHELVKTDVAFNNFDKNICAPIDKHDNGVDMSNSISFMISSMNKMWDEDVSDDERFFKAVDIAKQLIERYIDSLNSTARAEDVIREAMNGDYISKGIMVLEEFAPWRENLGIVDPEGKVILCVYPSKRGGWCIQTKDSNEYPLPAEWLEHKPEGMSFCHITRFLASCDTKEHAIEYALVAMIS
ncbi:MAG: MYG1 family protein [Clostridiales bacterium]|nr:MYG1 family protein [Clostridiales bacterium]